jgi:hypothetical protein
VDEIKAYRADGGVDSAFDAELLFLSLLATIMIPAMLPQIVRLVADLDPKEATFTTAGTRNPTHSPPSATQTTPDGGCRSTSAGASGPAAS